MRRDRTVKNKEDFLVIEGKKVYYKARKTLAKESRYDENSRFGRRLKYGT